MGMKIHIFDKTHIFKLKRLILMTFLKSKKNMLLTSTVPISYEIYIYIYFAYMGTHLIFFRGRLVNKNICSTTFIFALQMIGVYIRVYTINGAAVIF